MYPHTARRLILKTSYGQAVKASISMCTEVIVPESRTVFSSQQIKFYTTMRSFHGTSPACAKKGKPSKNDSDDSPIVMPDMKVMDGQMERKLTRLTDEFAKLRNGQPNTEVFRTVMIDSGGARLSVADAGQLTVKSPTKMSISVFDPSLVSAVAEAIRECGMSLTPVIEGSSIVMSIPKPSKESKEALVKTAKMIADKVRHDIHLHVLFCLNQPQIFLNINLLLSSPYHISV